MIGDNEYYGWFDAGGGGDDDRDALSPYLDFVHAVLPDQGTDGHRVRIRCQPQRTWSRSVAPIQFQVNTIAFHLGVFATKPYLSGAMYFALQDYVAFPGYVGGDPRPNPPFNEKGVIDPHGNPKPSFATISQIYHATVQIAPASKSRRRPRSHRLY